MFGSDLVTRSLLAGALLSSLLIGPMLGSSSALADQSAGRQITAYLIIQGSQEVNIGGNGHYRANSRQGRERTDCRSHREVVKIAHKLSQSDPGTQIAIYPIWLTAHPAMVRDDAPHYRWWPMLAHGAAPATPWK